MKLWNEVSQTACHRLNPMRGRLQFLMEVALILKHQLDDHPYGADEEAVGKTVKNTAQQAQEKTPTIRVDETPDLT